MVKMQWLVNFWLNHNDERDSLLLNVQKDIDKNNYLCVSCPTGTGKSGLVYWDIAQKIKSFKRSKTVQKQIFVISSPVLKLNSQFTKDLFEFLYLAKLIDDKNSVCGQLSSDVMAKRGTIFVDSVDTNIEKVDALDALSYDVKNVFIIACHKSLYKLSTNSEFINMIGNNPIHCYIDEAHTLKVLGV